MKAGFSLVEMTVAMALVLAITGAVFALMDPAHGVFRTQPEAVDMQQRVRVAVDAIARDLIMAGAGGGKYFASVMPLRRGSLSPDSPGSFFDDRISILYVPASAPETTVNVTTDAGSAVYVGPQAGCPAAAPLCGFAANALVAIFDETGTYDTFRIIGVQNEPPALLRVGGALSKSYAVGATVAQIVSSTFWLRTDAGAGTSELMNYDGRLTDLPVVDAVTGLVFESYGDPAPPVLRRPLSDEAGPWTSYGPRPPEVGVDDPATPAHGPGENCIFTVFEGATVVRSEIPDLGSASSSLVRLDEGRLSDGPWCPDPSAPNRFDADLLRVRRVRVTLRVRSSRSFLRMPLPDRQITFDVTPRNLSLPQ